MRNFLTEALCYFTIKKSLIVCTQHSLQNSVWYYSFLSKFHSKNKIQFYFFGLSIFSKKRPRCWVSKKYPKCCSRSSTTIKVLWFKTGEIINHQKCRSSICRSRPNQIYHLQFTTCSSPLTGSENILMLSTKHFQNINRGMVNSKYNRLPQTRAMSRRIAFVGCTHA